MPKNTLSFIHFSILNFLIYVFSFDHSLSAIYDLEERSQDFVLEIKKIEIPGHSHAFNPSIVRWRGSLLMSFREIPFPHAQVPITMNCGGCSGIGLVWLDDDFNPIGEPQMLSLDSQNLHPLVPPRSEDARLIIVGEHLYIVYSDNKDENLSLGGYRVYIAELDYDGTNFIVLHDECLLRFEGENPNRREKNWVPFDYEGHLMLAYSLLPHRILRPLIGEGECETFAESKGLLDWNWGELRGGTPGIKIGHQYLSFFHSSIDIATLHSSDKVMPHYFMGAYTFAAEPPFEITQISPTPIVGKGFYRGPTYIPYWKPVRVVFPCGLILEGNDIWVSYGRQDHEIWVVHIDKEALLESLVPVMQNP